MIKKIIYNLLSKVLPKLKLLKKNINWNEFIDYKSDTIISKKSKVNSPYNLQNIELGDYSYIDRNSFASNVTIGKFCSIGPNFFCGWGIHPTHGISTSPMFYSTKKQNGFTLSLTDKIEERKRITIGNDVFIGANVTVLDGVTIGHGAVIGAGSIVSKDISAYAIAVGSPIKVIKYRFKQEQIDALLKIKWWNFPPNELMEVERSFFDVESFIKKYAI